MSMADSDKLRIQIIGHGLVGKNFLIHRFARPAPAGVGIEEHEFIFCFGLRDRLLQRSVEETDPWVRFALCCGATAKREQRRGD